MSPYTRYSRRRRDAVTGYLFLAPWFIGLVVITLGPILASLYLSFTDYSCSRRRSGSASTTTRRCSTDPRLHKSLLVTFHLRVRLGAAAAGCWRSALALVLDKGMRGLAFYRSVFYLPSLLGGSVAIAILWRQIFGQDGLVNDVLA